MNDKLSTARHVVQELLWMRTKHMISCMELRYSHKALVSGTVANLVMEDVEERALATKSIPLHFWKLYICQLVSGGQGQGNTRMTKGPHPRE